MKNSRIVQVLHREIQQRSSTSTITTATASTTKWRNDAFYSSSTSIFVDNFSARRLFSRDFSSRRRYYHHTGARRSPYAHFIHKTVMIPHDEKRHRGGEDAVATNSNLLVVADGVGGWATEGINPALYARALTQRIIDLGGDHDDAVDTDENNSTDTTTTADTRTHLSPLKELVHRANLHAAAQHLGSATCTTVRLVSNSNNKTTTSLETLNIGDSGYAIFRRRHRRYKEEENDNDDDDDDGWKMMYASQPGQKGFNYPDQLGGKYGDDARRVGISNTHDKIQTNDIVVVFSDGVSDNLEPHHFPIAALNKCIDTNPNTRITEKLHGAADCLARVAYFLGKDPKYDSPFARGARKVGWGDTFTGGKHDDITVTIAQIMIVGENNDDDDDSGTTDLFPPLPSSDDDDDDHGASILVYQEDVKPLP